MQAGTILIVDDTKSVLTSLEMLLEDVFERVVTASNPNRILSLLDQLPIDLIILDMNFSAGVNTGNEGLFWLRRIREIAPDVPVVMLTAYGDVELAVKALKAGAVDFMLKPWENEVLLEKVLAVFSVSAEARRKAAKGKGDTRAEFQRKSEPAMVIGRSAAMMKLVKVVTKVAKTDANVLITGENGTGKEILAREIHRLSLRSRREMVHVDMGAISESLFESELFGHEKRAFTEAYEMRAGKFEAADGGTLFLDEIGNLPLASQAKLLAALQNREIVRVGSNRRLPVDIRLVAATNRNLSEMVSQGLFREDLYYRINTIQLEIPPLRDRREDIPVFAEFFLKKYRNLYQRPELVFQPQAVEKLRAYAWPGNIRELQHTIEKAVILAEKAAIRPIDLSVNAARSSVYAEVPNLGDLERQAIELAIRQNDGNLTAAAEQLGVTRQFGFRRNIQVPFFRQFENGNQPFCPFFLVLLQRNRFEPEPVERFPVFDGRRRQFLASLFDLGVHGYFLLGGFVAYLSQPEPFFPDVGKPGEAAQDGKRNADPDVFAFIISQLVADGNKAACVVAFGIIVAGLPGKLAPDRGCKLPRRQSHRPARGQRPEFHRPQLRQYPGKSVSFVSPAIASESFAVRLRSSFSRSKAVCRLFSRTFS